MHSEQILLDCSSCLQMSNTANDCIVCKPILSLKKSFQSRSYKRVTKCYLHQYIHTMLNIDNIDSSDNYMLPDKYNFHLLLEGKVSRSSCSSSLRSRHDLRKTFRVFDWQRPKPEPICSRDSTRLTLSDLLRVEFAYTGWSRLRLRRERVYAGEKLCSFRTSYRKQNLQKRWF